LSGGVGGARLCHGLSRALDPERLTLIVNTGDDLVHWGLFVSPDLDTVMYTLADLGDVARGWGLANETFSALEMMRGYGAEAWFALGDRDLATHLSRSQWLREGQTLTEVTARLCRSLGVRVRILPMSDQPCATMIETPIGVQSFQRWLVEHRAQHDALRVFAREPAQASSEVLRALDAADLVVLGPSNPYVSIDPILALPGVRERVAKKPVVAVSPIVHGAAVKGPLARMLRTLDDSEATPAAIVKHYAGLVRGFVVERGDAAAAAAPGVRVLETETVMHTREHSLALAREVLRFAETL
jgi:LPPG:FO 2-phospho-L-lactate transferase